MRPKLKYLLLLILIIAAAVPAAIYLYNQNQDKINSDNLPQVPSSSIFLLNLKKSSGNEVCSRVHPVVRTLDTSDPKKIANALLQGPTTEEKDQGYFSPYDFELLDSIRSVEVKDARAHIQFTDFSDVISNGGTTRSTMAVPELSATTSGAPLVPITLPQCGVAALEIMFTTTFKSMYPIQTVVFSFNGNVAKYYKWSGTTCPDSSNMCQQTAVESTQVSFVQKSLFNNLVKIKVPSDWIVQENEEVKILNTDQNKPIRITLNNKPLNSSYSCPEKMNISCDKVKINNVEWNRGQYQEMNGIVIELEKTVKTNSVRIKIETPYVVQTAAGMELVSEIINSIEL